MSNQRSVMSSRNELPYSKLAARSSQLPCFWLMADGYFHLTTIAGTVAPHDHESLGAVKDVSVPPAVMLAVPAF